MSSHAPDSHLLSERALAILPLADKLPEEYFYASLTLCVIDAVWSMTVRYQTTRNVVARYCRKYGVVAFRPDRRMPSKESQDSMDALCNSLGQMSPDESASEVFGNHQRTSPKSGILKSEAVHRFATVLLRHNIQYLQDAALVLQIPSIERDILQIPGQKSCTCFEYFMMLAGSDDLIKPDRMIGRFLDETLKREVLKSEFLPIITEAASLLRNSYPEMNPRLLDYLIWNYQQKHSASNRKVGKTPKPPN